MILFKGQCQEDVDEYLASMLTPYWCMSLMISMPPSMAQNSVRSAPLLM